MQLKRFEWCYMESYPVNRDNFDRKNTVVWLCIFTFYLFRIPSWLPYTCIIDKGHLLLVWILFISSIVCKWMTFLFCYTTLTLTFLLHDIDRDLFVFVTPHWPWPICFCYTTLTLTFLFLLHHIDRDLFVFVTPQWPWPFYVITVWYLARVYSSIHTMHGRWSAMKLQDFSR